LNLKTSDLFKGKPAAKTPRLIIASYNYENEAGETVFQVLRYHPKDFRQRQADGKGGWIDNMNGVKRILYRLPEISRDVKRGLPIIVCAGEKDVLAMVERGYSATTNAGGENSKWETGYSEALRGASVVIIADKDKTGREHAPKVAKALQGIAATVRVIEVPDVNGKQTKDPHDFFEAGGDAAKLQEVIDAAPEWKPDSLAATASDKQDALAIIDAAAFIAEPLPQPPELVRGILHLGSKLVFGGDSKSFKTWSLLDLAFSVAHGLPWLSFETTQGRSLFLNFEIQPWSWQKRIQSVAKAKGVTLEPGRMALINLRGKAARFDFLLPQIQEAAKQDFALIVLDPIYKLYGGADENKAGDVAALLNAIEDLAVQTGAAVAFGAHFSKGNQAAKQNIDRISGSGVFARDPDTLLIFTRHEEDDAFTVESVLRNFAPVEPFAVRWQCPLMVLAAELDPARLKGGRKPEHSPDDLLFVLPPGGLLQKDWIEAAENEGISRRTFFRLKKQLEQQDKVIQERVTLLWKPVKKP
jgi:hypothetical protein